eukprot:Colp12_sorted_trinity150504_noHs@10417
MADRPNVDLSKPRYDQSTYFGRVRHFMDVTDPRTLFASHDELKAAMALLDDYKSGKPINTTEDKLWEAKKLVDSTNHPDTNEPILLPFRMASFVPTNLIVTLGLLLPNPTIASTLFWQWANQSVNVAFNYFNANKSSPMSYNETAVAYAGAAGTSMGIAVGLKKLVGGRKSIAAFIPFAAVASAGVVNVFLMRGNELRNGITVKDDEGTVHGKSSTAAFHALTQVSISRILTALPALTIPPVVISALERRFPKMEGNPRYNIPLNLGLITLCLMTALPCAIGVFPQQGSLPVSKLEPEFATLKKADGTWIDTLYYNKGL